MPSRGIDVSNHQQDIDWAAVAASGVEFAIAKVTEGTGYFDRYFPGNWQGMKANGILRGAYHFGRPSVNGAVAEANFFLASVNQAGGLDVGDLVVLDLEDPDASGDLSTWTLQWLQHVEAAVGYKPILYSGRYYLKDHGCTIQPLADYPLWLAAYQSEMPANVPPWPTYLLWQYTSQGSVPGVRAAVDMDTVYNLNELRAYGKPEPVPDHTTDPAPPAPAPEPPAAGFRVGPGVLAEMARRGDEPITSEVYFKDDAGVTQYSVTLGRSGSTYMYSPHTGLVYVTHTDVTAAGRS